MPETEPHSHESRRRRGLRSQPVHAVAIVVCVMATLVLTPTGAAAEPARAAKDHSAGSASPSVGASEALRGAGADGEAIRGSSEPAPAARPADSPQRSGPPPGAEIAERRDRTSKTYATEAPGVFRKVVSAKPMHYQGPSGEWTDIDSRLRQNAAGRFNNGRNDFGLELSPRPSERDFVKISRGDVSLGWGLAGARRPAETRRSEDTLLLHEVLPSVDIEIASLAEGVREDLILTSVAAPRRFVFPLSTEGLNAQAVKGGAVVYTDASGKVVGHTPKAWMFDGAGDSPRQADGEASGDATLNVIPLRRWASA